MLPLHVFIKILLIVSETPTHVFAESLSLSKSHVSAALTGRLKISKNFIKSANQFFGIDIYKHWQRFSKFKTINKMRGFVERQ